MSESENVTVTAQIDLGDIALDDWGRTVKDLIRAELHDAVAREVKRGVRENPKVKEAIKTLADQTVKKILEMPGETGI